MGAGREVRLKETTMTDFEQEIAFLRTRAAEWRERAQWADSAQARDNDLREARAIEARIAALERQQEQAR